MSVELPASVKSFASVQVLYWGLFVLLCGLTQSVGPVDGALVFIAISAVWPSAAMLRGSAWSRRGYLIAGPFTPVMAFSASGSAEFLSEFLQWAALFGFVLYALGFALLL